MHEAQFQQQSERIMNTDDNHPMMACSCRTTSHASAPRQQEKQADFQGQDHHLTRFPQSHNETLNPESAFYFTHEEIDYAR